MNLIKIKSYLNPVNFLKKGSYNQRKLACLILVTFRFRHFLLRWFLKPTILQNDTKIKELIHNLNKNGYATIKSHDKDLKKIIADIIQQCNQIKNERNLNDNNNKKYLITLLDKYDFNLQDKFFKLITNRLFLTVSSHYLHSIPILTYVNLWFSPKKTDDNLQGSQLWHLDHESFKQLKIFLFISDVDKQSGPTTLMNKSNSLKMQTMLKYNLKENNKHFELKIPENEEISIEGKKGDILLIDTSKCFHRGAQNLLKERLVLMFQFLPVYAYNVEKFFNFKKLNCSNNSLINKVLCK